MFEKFKFSEKQINRYYESAKKDFRIAFSSNVPEVSFRFSYDALLKLAIAICAIKDLRVKSKRGHHIELIKKLSIFLQDPEIEILANEMRSKRNWELYGGGATISQKQNQEYILWVKQIFKKAEKMLVKQPKLKFKNKKFGGATPKLEK
ncbi:hypothetical protein K9K85_01210 [Patescibacteria group bacterium]|nr:hypothetical protein [Patescibacteria group bacterium]